MAATILVVDDDESIRDLLRLHLSAAGYAVHVAEDAIGAGYMVLRSPPDLIICDINMPHMDGFEFIAALKSDKTLPAIPVIFLTTIEEGEYRWALSLGVYRSEEAAQARLNALSAMGVGSALMAPRATLVPKVWLQIKVVDPALEARLRDAARQVEGSELRACP